MRISVTLFMAACVASVHAQNVTYNHDSPKKNQIMVMETGSGSLTPELYYTLLHNSYRKSASSKNKLSYRTVAGMEAYSQVEYAEEIDSAMTQRAKIEALNMADRQVDLAWSAEGNKLEGCMAKFKKNIDRILPVGGTLDDKRRWEEYYNVYDYAVREIKRAYMPNAQRKKEYLRIYEEMTIQNETLVKFLVQLHGKKRTAVFLAATNPRVLHKSTITANAITRWKEAGYNIGGMSSTASGGTPAEGEEIVER